MNDEFTIKITKGDSAYATIEILSNDYTIFSGNAPINKETMDKMWKQGVNIEIEDRDAYYNKIQEGRKDRAHKKRVKEMKEDAYEYLGDYLVKNNYVKQFMKIEKISGSRSDIYDYTIVFDVNLYAMVEAYSYEYVNQDKCESCINLNPRRRGDNFYIKAEILDEIAQNINQIMSDELYEPFYNKFEVIKEKQLQKYQERGIIEVL